ncbi:MULTISPECIES: M42 family metallopeptidase [unclassified Thermoactinomyces]|uniref:M42 family metallopeptidase n=1 Tax=unclassified Thermoactinomyces TaxID=2634588 RepID=UPI0018DBD828|nr:MULTISPECIES: M42 family metallopeptidase [unclassified Thermoactinomyces]MBH8603138.1 M42 family metallopeptidase [Thermoactinomyces sp. CICC 10522]MBH8607055.1 M42 family metallopeptidase [Thermoactinomyces sp. CICC 10521]
MDRLTLMMKELTEANGVAGFEGTVRQKMEQYLKPLSEEILKDRLGGVVGKKTGDSKGPRVLLAGHLDEVGFMVTRITERGFLRFQPLGGWWPHNVLAHRVTVQSRRGDYIGVVGSKAPHVLTPEERRKVLDLKDMFIDVGAGSREEVEEMGIRPGDPVVPVSDFFTLKNGELWGGKALDNRAGCAMAVEVLKNLQDEDHPNVVFAGATVQEEVGMRGASTLAHLIKPDIAFALDVGIAYDTPGFESYPGEAALGKGPLIYLMDFTMIGHGGLRNLIIETAEELEIPLQYDALLRGGTDGGRFHLNGGGCPTVALGFPTRYIHSHNALMSRTDFEQAVRLVTAVVKKLDHKQMEKLCG